MKSITFKLLVLLCISIITGCGRGFYYSNDAIGTEVFTIDKNTEVFVRKLYSKTNQFNGPELISLENKDEAENANLIEVQYIIINKDKVLYISTVASRYIYDKTESYLIKYGDEYYPNSFYFNSFYFGKYDSTSEKFAFKNEKNAQDWNLSWLSDKELELVYINNYTFKKEEYNGKKDTKKNLNTTEVIEESVGHKIIFKRIKNMHYLSFKIPDDRKNLMSPEKSTRKYNKAYHFCVVYKDDNKEKIKYLFIPFSEELIPKYKSLKFNSKRVRYY